MADVSKTYLRGLFLGDPRDTPTKRIDGIIGKALYPYSNDLKAMAPSPTLGLNATTREHYAYGNQASGYDYAYSRTIGIVKGGNPRPDGASFRHKRVTAAGVADTYWHDWNPPCTITDWGWVGTPSAAKAEANPHAIRIYQDGGTARLLVACYDNGDNSVRIYRRDYPDEAWTFVTALTTNGATTVPSTGSCSPCLVQITSGRVLLYMWVEIGTTETGIGMWYSDNEGATWSEGGVVTPATMTTADISRLRVRAVEIGGSVAMFVNYTDTTGAEDRQRIIQYASSDNGASFVEIAHTAGYSAVGDLESRTSPDVAVVGGKMVVAYIKERAAGTSTLVPHRVILGSAHHRMTAAIEDIACENTDPMVWTTVGAGSMAVQASLALCKDDDDVLWLYGRDITDDAVYGRRSNNYGNTFKSVGSGSAAGFGTAWSVPRAASYPTHICAVATANGIHIIHAQLPIAAGNYDTTLSETILGGWTQAPFPVRYDFAPDLDKRGSWDTTWQAWDLPDSLATWTGASGGAPTIALDDTGLSYTGGAGDSRAYTNAVAITSSANTPGITATVTGKTTTASATGGHFLDVREGDGATTVNVRAVVQSGTASPYTITVTLLDMNAAGATLATLTGVPRHSYEPTAIAAARMAQVILHVKNAATNNCACYLVWGGDVLDLEVNVDATQAASVAANRVQFGWVIGTTTVGHLTWAAYTQGDYQGLGWVDLPTAPAVGRNLSGTPSVDPRVTLSSVGGAFRAGDTASIRLIPDPDWRRLNPLYDPSPLSGITLSSLSTPVLIDLDAGGVNSHLIGPTWGVYVAGSAAYQIGVNTYSAAAADVGSYTQSTAIFTGGRYVRTGNVVVVSATAFTQDTRWHPENSLAGCWFLMRNGANTDQFKIIGNTPGTFSATSTTQSCRLLLEAAEAAAYNGLDANDTFDILAANYLLLFNDNLAVASMKVTLTSYLASSVGAALIFPGRMAWFGKEYSSGEVWESTPQNATHESWGGQRSVISKGKVRRAIQVAWTDPVDSRPVSTTTPIPDHIAAYAAGIPVASPADTAMQINGLLHALKGAALPCVLVDNVPQAAAASTVSFIPDIGTNLGRCLYGRIVTPVRLSSIVGLGGTDGYLQTVATVTVEEEV